MQLAGLQYVIVVFPDHTHLLFDAAKHLFRKNRVNRKIGIYFLLQLSPPMLSFKLKNLIKINHLGKIKLVYNIPIKIKILCYINNIRLKYIVCRYKG